MKRRNFVILAASGIAAVSIPSYFYFYKDGGLAGAKYFPNSLMLIMDPDQISALGKIYQDEFRQENSQRSLVRHLKEGLDIEDDGIDKALEQKIIQDFNSGNTVMLDGWILSVTEARQCALFSIQH